jgi:hypothetical protein
LDPPAACVAERPAAGVAELDDAAPGLASLPARPLPVATFADADGVRDPASLSFDPDTPELPDFAVSLPDPEEQAASAVAMKQASTMVILRFMTPSPDPWSVPASIPGALDHAT